jgi:hypothetical protein
MPEYKIYCYETCTREQAKAPGEDGAFWVYVPTGEIMRYIWPEPELPRGAEYVRPVSKGSK